MGTYSGFLIIVVAYIGYWDACMHAVQGGVGDVCGGTVSIVPSLEHRVSVGDELRVDASV